MDTSENSSILSIEIKKVKGEHMQAANDVVAIEEPLEIRLCFSDNGQRKEKSISVTMRTPGNDFDLATGFLFTEGIINNSTDVTAVEHCTPFEENVVRVELSPDIHVALNHLERNFYTTSSCGICGKSSIDAVKTVRRIPGAETKLRIPPEILYSLGKILRDSQDLFDRTGGIHGWGLFDPDGKLILSREDVGRHNALDKLIGAAIQKEMIPLNNYVLLLSCRASFELIQKAWMAGIKIIAAVGAPSSLAVQMAKESDITLVGFLKNNSFNIYSGEKRIAIQPSYTNIKATS
ncbi:formate dehydrogenase accessory sulfurtransferase FdhD [soil metagenome]